MLKVLKSSVVAAVLVVLGGCGGGRDDDGATVVSSDVWSVPASSTASLRALGETKFLNQSPVDATVQISFSAKRRIDAPAGSGSLRSYHFLRINVSGKLQSYPPASDTSEDVLMPAGASKAWAQSYSVPITVPAGQTLTVESVTSIAPGLGIDGAKLTTTDLRLLIKN